MMTSILNTENIGPQLCEVTLRNIQGNVVIKTLPISEMGFYRRIELYHKGALIQEAFDILSFSERGFLMTGLSDEAWEEMCEGNEVPDYVRYNEIRNDETSE